MIRTLKKALAHNVKPDIRFEKTVSLITVFSKTLSLISDLQICNHSPLPSGSKLGVKIIC